MKYVDGIDDGGGEKEEGEVDGARLVSIRCAYTRVSTSQHLDFIPSRRPQIVPHRRP